MMSSVPLCDTSIAVYTHALLGHGMPVPTALRVFNVDVVAACYYVLAAIKHAVISAVL
jgi:hypothetical protein